VESVWIPQGYPEGGIGADGKNVNYFGIPEKGVNRAKQSLVATCR
jgi:hypothetical protein